MIKFSNLGFSSELRSRGLITTIITPGGGSCPGGSAVQNPRLPVVTARIVAHRQ